KNLRCRINATFRSERRIYAAGDALEEFCPAPKLVIVVCPQSRRMLALTTSATYWVRMTCARGTSDSTARLFRDVQGSALVVENGDIFAGARHNQAVPLTPDP